MAGQHSWWANIVSARRLRSQSGYRPAQSRFHVTLRLPHSSRFSTSGYHGRWHQMVLSEECKGGRPTSSLPLVWAGSFTAGGRPPEIQKSSSLPRFLLLFPHHPAQRPIDPSLVAAPLCFEPGQEVSVRTQCDRLLARLLDPLGLLNHEVSVLRLLHRSHQSDRPPPSRSPGLRRCGLGNSCRPFHLHMCILLYVQFRQYEAFLKEHFSNFCAPRKSTTVSHLHLRLFL
jgi:hypothetical protein